MLIYLITNRLNGKQYVGQTVVSVQARWQRHCWPCNNMAISLAIRKYGRENFSIEVLEECVGLAALNEAELRWARQLNTFAPHGYNLKAGGGRGAMSEETKLKISKSNKGKTRSAATRRRLSESHKGHSHPPEVRQKLAAARKGKRLPDAAYRTMANRLSKTYTLVSPDGVQVTVTNMREHCRRHGLSPAKMCLVVQGKKKHHRGWTGSYAGAEINKGRL